MGSAPFHCNDAVCFDWLLMLSCEWVQLSVAVNWLTTGICMWVSPTLHLLLEDRWDKRPCWFCYVISLISSTPAIHCTAATCGRSVFLLLSCVYGCQCRRPWTYVNTLLVATQWMHAYLMFGIDLKCFDHSSLNGRRFNRWFSETSCAFEWLHCGMRWLCEQWKLSNVICSLVALHRSGFDHLLWFIISIFDSGWILPVETYVLIGFSGYMQTLMSLWFFPVFY